MPDDPLAVGAREVEGAHVDSSGATKEGSDRHRCCGHLNGVTPTQEASSKISPGHSLRSGTSIVL